MPKTDTPTQPKSLTLKQELFVSAYLGAANGNATEAARIAGYKNPEISAKNNVRNHTIAARISERVAHVAASADQVLAELTDVAMADWRDFVEIVARDKQGKPVRVKFDLTNKVKSLELLGKYHQLFTEKHQIDMDIRDHRVIGVAQTQLDAMFAPAEKRADA